MSNKYAAVFKSDMKNTFRDPSLIMVLCAPLLVILMVRFGFPILLEYVPDATDYRREIVSFFVMLCSIFPGIAMSFILLDEKDVQLFPVMKVTPVSFSGFLLVRLSFMVLLGFVISLLLLLLNGVFAVKTIEAIQFSILAGLNSPILILLISHFAKNKIEGMTLLKVSNIILMLPIIIFFFDAKWEFILGILPPFWVYKFLDTSHSFVIFTIGLCFLGMVNGFVIRFVVRNS